MPVGCVAGRPAGCPASGSLPVVPIRSVLFPAFGGAGEVMEHAFHIFRMELFFQFGGRVQRLDAAVHHDRDSVAVFRFVHIVCGDEDRDPAVGSVVDQFPKLPSWKTIFGSWKIATEKANFCFHPNGRERTSASRSCSKPSVWSSESVLAAISSVFMP